MTPGSHPSSRRGFEADGSFNEDVLGWVFRGSMRVQLLLLGSRVSEAKGKVMRKLKELLEKAKLHPMTPEERERQRRSFVYGNLKIENDSVTRELVDQVADEEQT